MTVHEGQKLHYLGFSRNGQYGAIYAQVTKILNETDVQIKNENGCIFVIKKHWITGINRIVVPEAECKKTENYLKCKCGNMRFSYNSYTKTMVCQDCYAEYPANDLGMLDKTSYTVKEENNDKRVLN